MNWAEVKIPPMPRPTDGYQVAKAIQEMRHVICAQCGTWGLTDFRIIKTDIDLHAGQIFLQCRYRCKANLPETSHFVFSKAGELLSVEEVKTP